MNAMMYKSYVAAVEFDAEDRIFRPPDLAPENQAQGTACPAAQLLQFIVGDVRERFAGETQAHQGA
jgi:hypothetical protein